jgi:putative component of toxin-antitoxin plasmid stabilization module
VYFRSEIRFLLLLLGGSSKKGQQKAIDAAKAAWKLYQLERKQLAQKVKRK